MIIMYNCHDCDYTTDDRGSWAKHLKTKKHLKKTIYEESESELLLKNENKFLIEKIKMLETQLEDKIKMFESQLEDKNKQLIENKKELDHIKKQFEETKFDLDKQIKLQFEETKSKLTETEKKLDKQIELRFDSMRDENIYKSQMINEAGTIVKESMSTLNYVIKNYPDAPPLEKITNYDFILNNKEKFIKEIIYQNRKKLLDEYLGKILITIYKKSDPKAQSLWSSDISRLNYVVKEKYSPKSKLNKIVSKWTNDKNGIKLKENVIRPFLNTIRNVGEEYIRNNVYNDDDYDSDDSIDTDESTESDQDIKNRNMLEVASINSSILDQSLEKNISKMIAPYFQSDK